MSYTTAPTITLVQDNNATAVGSESLAFITPASGTGELPTTPAWTRFPCVIKEKIATEPKELEILDDKGRLVYSYSKPAKVVYSGVVFQRSKLMLDFFSTYANQCFVLWVVIGEVGTVNQEIAMYGKFAGKLDLDLSGDPNIPIEFKCLVNAEVIAAGKPDADECFATTISIAAKGMYAIAETAIA